MKFPWLAIVFLSPPRAHGMRKYYMVECKVRHLLVSAEDGAHGFMKMLFGRML